MSSECEKVLMFLIEEAYITCSHSLPVGSYIVTAVLFLTLYAVKEHSCVYVYMYNQVIKQKASYLSRDKW